MKKRVTSVLCVMTMLVCMLLLPARNVQAADDDPMLDGSYLTHDTESTGYSGSGGSTRGEDLLVGYSKCVVLGSGKIYAGGTTIAAHEVPSIQVVVIVERAQEGDTAWSPYDTWRNENLNTDRVNSNRALDVEGGYYYRVRCLHAAGEDATSSFTDGVYVEEPSLLD